MGEVDIYLLNLVHHVLGHIDRQILLLVLHLHVIHVNPLVLVDEAIVIGRFAVETDYLGLALFASRMFLGQTSWAQGSVTDCQFALLEVHGPELFTPAD